MNRLDSLFLECFLTPTADGQDLAESLLLRNGYAPLRGFKYVYGEGTVPLLLVAHTDTVHKRAPSAVYHDAANAVCWAPEGLGADDRAGVYGIAKLLAAGHRPHVLFTDEEECGAAGAHEAAADLSPNVRLLIQLDRQGARDAVYYDCVNPSLERWITRRGYKTAWGTFTDISILAPAWDVGAVNLSVGYYRQHSCAEYLRLNELEDTLRRVAGMLRKPPRRRFAYDTSPPSAPRSLLWDNPLADDGTGGESWEREYLRMVEERMQRDSAFDRDRWAAGTDDDYLSLGPVS